MSAKLGAHLGPYEIISRAGAGGMGEVWKARDTRLGRTVAIKISDQKFSDRFDCEAIAVAALNHPYISALYDIGPDYLVMEYIESEPLKGPLPLGKALEYAKQILDALHAAHRAGIVHRDLKPANILVAKSGVKVLDFGLAKRTEALSSVDGLTALGTRSLRRQHRGHVALHGARAVTSETRRWTLETYRNAVQYGQGIRCRPKPHIQASVKTWPAFSIKWWTNKKR